MYMDHDSLLNNARWEIIKAISKGRASATDLARLTKSSLPNVSQQLKLLEAYDLLEYLKDQKSKQGKPRQLYHLKRDFCQLTFARHGFADKRFFNPDAYHVMLLNICFLPSLQDHAFLHKYLLTMPEVMHNCAVAFLKSNETDIEVFLLTDEIELIRQKYSNTYVEHAGKTRKVIAWTHSAHEVSDGLGRREPYFEHLTEEYHVLHDPKSAFDKIKRKEAK
jgi:hypothetical protein